MSDRSVLPDGRECPIPAVSLARELIDNLPYALMILLGASVLVRGLEDFAWRWAVAGLYLAYGVAGAVWIMFFVCPYCHFYDTRLCPCGYGRIAPRLRSRKDGDQFARQFRRHIPVIVPLWFLPLIAGGLGLAGQFSWGLLALLVAFALDAFAVLPLVSRAYGCKACPQKQTCPWMGGCKSH